MTKEYYRKLAERESSNNPKAVNDFGFIGLYQMGEPALIDVGYYKPDGSKKNDWIGEWTGKNGINNKEDFLSHPEVQDKAIKEYHSIIWNRYLKDYKKYEGSEIDGIILTKAAMVSCAHLGGQLRMKEFIDTNGRLDGEDGNHVPCSKYMKEFGDYDLDLSEDKKESQKNKKEESDKENDLINNLFQYFDSPEAQDPSINNLQRFGKLEEKARAGGDNEFADMFENLAAGHQQVFDFLDNLDQQDDL